jgi:ABC-type uncharacterized transport system ATPase subunit
MTTASDIAIEVEGLTKSFDGRKAVRNLSLRVKRGQIYGFLGPNGQDHDHPHAVRSAYPRRRPRHVPWL